MTFNLRRAQILVLCLLISSLSTSQSLFPFRQHDKWGFCDSSKQIVIVPEYGSATIFSRTHIATVRKDSLWGFIDTIGRPLTPIQYDRWSYFWCNRTFVWKNGKVGILDVSGREVVPIEFEDVNLKCTGPIALKTDEGWHLHDTTGTLLTKRAYDSFLLSSSVLIGYQKDGLWGFMTKEGKVRTKPRFEEFNGFSRNGLAAVQSNGKWMFVDVKARVRIALGYDEPRNFQKEGAWVKVGGKWGLVDSTGTTLIQPRYEDVSYFKEGLAFVQEKGKWGYIDGLGNTIIPFLYTYAFDFSEGLAEVCIGDSCGYIDRRGHTIIPFMYDVNFGGEFNEGLAEVCSHDNHCGFIDQQGRIVVPVEFDSPYDYNSFDDGVGELLLPSDREEHEDDRDVRRFYFDRKGTLFFTP